jgi:hypothetical protein
MFVIHFNHLCRVYWWFMIDIDYPQQAPPHLGFYLSSIKSWITLDITLGQDINTKSFLVILALQDSKCLPWNFRRLKNGTAWNRSSSSFSQVNWRNILEFLKTKHSLPSPFVVLSNHSIYVVFLDPHQGITLFCILFVYFLCCDTGPTRPTDGRWTIKNQRDYHSRDLSHVLECMVYPQAKQCISTTLTQFLATQPVRTLNWAFCDPMHKYNANFNYTKHMFINYTKHMFPK